MFFISSQLMPLLRLDELVRAASPQTLAVVSFLFGRPELLENFFSGVIALAIFEAACVTEIVRAGIRSVSRGQWEAARSLGLGRFAAFARVVGPQATRRIVPPLANQSISLVKDSSIVSLISVQELTLPASSRSAAASGRRARASASEGSTPVGSSSSPRPCAWSSLS